MARLLAPALAAVMGAVVISGCGDDRSTPRQVEQPAHTSADIVFVVGMDHHHSRAIQVGQLAATKGADPRVREFGRLIVAQQTPELNRLREMQKNFYTANVDLMEPEGYVDEAEFQRLRFETGTLFDRDFLLLSATSEDGAAVMSQRELASGIYPPARELAASIATAPTTQIPQLRSLAASLPD